MKTITTSTNVYTAQELKENYPAAYKKALEEYRRDNQEYPLPWGDEIMQSMKETFKHAGITLRDWEISPYSQSYVKFDMDNEVFDLSGPRAVAWLENNLYAPLRLTKVTKAQLGYNRSYTNGAHPYEIGKIPPCPLTGYCADEDMIESLNKSVASGRTLGESFQGLAGVARRLMESEVEDNDSEECFLDMATGNDWQFTIDGKLF